jgi:spore coat protein U-like protein
VRVHRLLATVLAGLAAAGHADTGNLAVSATVLSRSLCLISGARTMNLAFGTIDPASTVDATASVTTSIACIGNRPATFSITAGGGLHGLGTGNRRMQNAGDAAEFLPYALSVTPAAATIPQFTFRLVTISGTIVPTQFQDVRFGAYSDTVAITLNP